MASRRASLSGNASLIATFLVFDAKVQIKVWTSLF